MKAALVNVYDFDHTVYDGDASLDFILFCLLRHPKMLRHLPAQGVVLLLYVAGLRTRKQVKEVAFAFLKDIPDTSLAVEQFWDKNSKKLKQWYLAQRTPADLIVSASPEFLLKPIAKRLEIATPVATRMNPKTGKIDGENCRADEKIRRLHELQPQIKIARCYSDSLSDIPLLNLATEDAYMVKKLEVVTLPRDTMGKVIYVQKRVLWRTKKS